jgi:hypothetical protein
MQHPDCARPDGDGIRGATDRNRLEDRPREWVDMRDGLVTGVGDPDASWSRSDRARDVSDRDLTGHAIVAGLDYPERVRRYLNGRRGAEHEHERHDDPDCRSSEPGAELQPPTTNHIECLEGGEVVLEPWGLDLVNPHAPIDVLEPAWAEIAQREDVAVLEQELAGVGDENLSTVSSGRDSGSTMNNTTCVPPVPDCGRPGVHPDPDFDQDTLRPPMLAECALYRDRGFDRIVRRWKDDEEGVALRVDLTPVVASEGVAQ